MRRALLTAVVALAAMVPAVGAGTSAAASTVPAYYPSGPQANVDQSALAGWTQCWSGTYNDTPTIASMLDACPGDYLLLAAGPVGSTVFDVLAAAPREDVLTPTTGDTTHDANGVGWYYDSSGFWGGWGFAKAGDPIHRDACDLTGSPYVPGPDPELRLCWHLFGDSLQVGYRSGANIDLNYSTAFRRAIYVPAADTTPPTVTCSATPTSLWPPNHKLRDVNVAVSVTDDESGPAGFTLVSVTSNEPDQGPSDVQGWVSATADTSGQLRAERSGSGNGRVYTLTYEGADQAGNTARCSTTVTVPHDASR